jgi:hypothetical protein
MIRSIVIVLTLLLIICSSAAWSSSLDDKLVDAAFDGKVEEVRKLLDRGADPNVKFRHGDRTPLFLVASARDTTIPSFRQDLFSVAKLLLERGANPNAQTPIGKTALMVAAEQNDPDMIELLLAKGADPVIKDGNGKTALAIALHKKYPRCIQFLTAATPENERPPEGPTVKETETTTFVLRQDEQIFDSIDTHRELWSKLSDRAALARAFASAMAAGNVLKVKSGTRLTLTGKATGIVTEVTVPRLPGKWWISNKVLQETGVKVPPVDIQYYNRERDAGR